MGPARSVPLGTVAKNIKKMRGGSGVPHLTLSKSNFGLIYSKSHKLSKISFIRVIFIYSLFVIFLYEQNKF